MLNGRKLGESWERAGKTRDSAGRNDEYGKNDEYGNNRVIRLLKYNPE
jgi:hypothetical protein